MSGQQKYFEFDQALAFAVWGGGGCREAYNLRRSIVSLRFNLVALISSSSYQLSSRLYLL